LRLRLHSLASCDLPSELARQNLELLALGDFEADNDAAEILPLARAGASLRFPAATLAVSARVDDRVQAFVGYGERSDDAGLDLLLWPERRTCALPTNSYPGKHGGQALGFSRARGLLLVTGGNDPLNPDALLGFLSFDTRTGALSAQGRLDGAPQALPRAFASVTAFGSQLLVAGGEKPVLGVPDDDIDPYALGEIFDPALGTFSGESIALLGARTHHAALVLDDGRTLLVGGRSKVGQTSIAQYQLEIVDPESRHATLADSITARIDPVALRLSDGRVLVGGGTTHDGAPVTPVAQWLTASGRLDSTRIDSVVPPRFERAFVATAGGGVLAVGGCEDRPPASQEDTQTCARCSHGCEPLDGFDAWWIAADGRASAVGLEGISAPRPILLPGSDGSPWLVAADRAAPDEPRLFRFNPWAQSFELAPELPSSQSLPRRDWPAPLEIARDTFVWLQPAAHGDQLMGLRLGTRSRYAQDPALVLLADPLDPGRPLHLTPDRPLGSSVSYDGRLTLSDPAVTIQVADTDYADLTLTLKLAQGTRRPPLVLLGQTPLGAESCPWPNGDGEEPPSIVRKGPQAVLRFRGGEPQKCPVEAGRVTLGLRAGDEPSVVSALSIRRQAD
jgi:hypothetical protein